MFATESLRPEQLMSDDVSDHSREHLASTTLPNCFSTQSISVRQRNHADLLGTRVQVHDRTDQDTLSTSSLFRISNYRQSVERLKLVLGVTQIVLAATIVGILVSKVAFPGEL
jgi:hypothetical protein